MKVAFAAILLFFISAVSANEYNMCLGMKGGHDTKGYNCAIPHDAVGPPLYHTERVIGRVTWSAPIKNPHGLFEFTAEYAYFQVKGFSRSRPIIGESVEFIIRAVVYPGRLTQRED